MSKCPIQPKEVTETYAKAGQIYADKVVAIRFDDVMADITSDDASETSVGEYKEDFVDAMLEAAFDPRGYPDQESFLDKITGGLENKFPDVSFDSLMDADFSASMTNRFSTYFDGNKKLIAKKIVAARASSWDALPPISPYVDSLNGIHPLFARYPSEDLSDVARIAGMAVAMELLDSSGEFVLKQAQNADTDPEIQKRYFVDTLADWGAGDNGNIIDDGAWALWDSYSAVFDDWTTEMGEDMDDYLDHSTEGSREIFSAYFNRKMGTKSKAPKQGRTPYLLAKKALAAPSSPQNPTKKIVELTEKSRQILAEFAKTRDLNLIFDGAENDEQEAALIDESLKLPR